MWETRTPAHPAPTTVVNQAKPTPKLYQRLPGKKCSDSKRKAEGKEKAIEDVHQNVKNSTADGQDPFQTDPSVASRSCNSSQGSDWLHRSQDIVSDGEGPPRQLSPSPVYIPATQLEEMMGKLQASLQKDFNDKIAELEMQKDRDHQLFLEKERLCAKNSRGKPDKPPPGGKDANLEQGREGQRDKEDEMDEDNDLVIPEGTTPLPSMPVDLATCPPYHCTKDVMFEGVDLTKVDHYLAQETTFFLVCFLGCNALLRDCNMGPNILMGLQRERNDVDTSNMTIAAATLQLVDKRGCMQLPSPGQPPHTLILSNVPPKLERVIQSKRIFIYGPGMAFIALSAQDITTPWETFMGMLHAGNSSNAIRHNDPTNVSLHWVMMTTALSQSQLVHDAVIHLFRCKQSEIDTCVAENIDTLTLRPAQASVKAKNVPPTTGYAIYMTPP
ncbi:hypothetical protein EDD18DRAFT_1443108 [Armillaria luteobubalina]|uniref:Uncharacterized protein n=1 Tax=Armillaria luteobubalina TaxID=153913 RepID=A0AA39UH59_9AGAR|nr:hypothetical protein EDD18DRAFT_1443108 [Armillaria luteobubalina]